MRALGLAFIAVALASAGCNSILGNEWAQVAPPAEADAGGSTGSGGTGGSGGQVVDSSVEGGDAALAEAAPDAGGQADADAGCTAETDPAFCSRVGKNCGPVTAASNCGVTRTVSSCGTCSGTDQCMSNVCCTAETDAAFCSRQHKNCGSVTAPDNCGTMRSAIFCGTCTAPDQCGSSNVCGCNGETDVVFCGRFGKNCGTVPGADTCGALRTVTSCGTCFGTGITCGGGGKANECGCSLETNPAFCARLSKNCDKVSGKDNCGLDRTVNSCGVCLGGDTCGGTGIANVCGCVPETNTQFCAGLGSPCGTVTELDNCGALRQNIPCSTCAAGGPQICTSGVCQAARCAGLPATCGPGGASDCCASAVVDAGTFFRSYDGATFTNQNYPATVSAFRLDTYEVTVGRFRTFVAAYPASLPTGGAGKNPNNASDPGWDANNWPAIMPLDQAALVAGIKCDTNLQTWTDKPSTNETRPINCVTWYEAFAFCIWDGGRLPTEAEWNYAAAGGSEQRVYPWSDGVLVGDKASYFNGVDCVGDGLAGCQLTDLVRVGTKALGNGKWGQADLAGNVAEWALDWNFPYVVSCTDCAYTTPGPLSRALRGGNFWSNAQFVSASSRGNMAPGDRGWGNGIRCARSAP
jgi:sulfatase modifying factor 1